MVKSETKKKKKKRKKKEKKKREAETGIWVKNGEGTRPQARGWAGLDQSFSGIYETALGRCLLVESSLWKQSKEGEEVGKTHCEMLVGESNEKSHSLKGCESSTLEKLGFKIVFE